MSIKTSNSKINLINSRIKYGTDGGINVDGNALVVNAATGRVGFNTLNPTTLVDISGTMKASSISDYSNSTGNNTQILTKVNDQNLWSYPGYNFNGSDMFPENTIFNIPGSLNIINQAWFGLVLHPNGLIYSTPYSKKSTIVINPYTNTWSETPIPILLNTDFGDYYRGGVVAPNGKIYYPPFIGQDILVNDVPNNRFYKINAPSGQYARYNGCVLGPNGLIYCVPLDENNVMVINPNTDTYTTLDISGVTGSLKWAGGVLANNGKIYCAPAYATSVLVIDTNNNTTQFDISGLRGYPATGGYTFNSFKWNGGALGVNNKIYFVPYSYPNTGSQVLEIDTSNNIGTLVGPSFAGSTNGRRYVGATLAQNGIIYSFFELTGPILSINTNTSTPTFSNTINVSQRCWGSCLAPNGKIYAIPIGSGSVDPYTIKELKTGISTQQPWMLAPQFNKF
jgi:hypothetical protein